MENALSKSNATRGTGELVLHRKNGESIVIRDMSTDKFLGRVNVEIRKNGHIYLRLSGDSLRFVRSELEDASK